MRARLTAAAATARHRPLVAAEKVTEFGLRWLLRIALPIAGAAAMLHLFPYHASAGGVGFDVQATLFTRSGITADTTFGSWIFSDVDGLPFGVHLTPKNVDVVRMAGAATQDPAAYVTSLRDDFADQVPQALAWLAGEALIGVLIGLAVAAAINLAVRQLRGQPRRGHELRRRGLQLLSAFVVLAVLGGYGAVSFNPHWAKRSRLTGTLGALQLFPGQLQQYYQNNATAFDVVNGIAAIQAQLQQHIEQTEAPPTAFNIMYISDVHLASTYPLLRQYAENFDVSLVINTGDEAQFGTAAEMTPEFRKQVRGLTKIAPMIWLAGNHDSPTTVDVMRSIKGVTVLGTKVAGPDGFEVGAQELSVFGLHIGGLPDPRVYGAAGPDGSNTPSVVDPLERKAADQAVQGIPPDDDFDIFATHEPTAADQLVKDLPGRIRQINSGHVHAQNADSEVQKDGVINLVEGSSGAGGLKEVGLNVTPVPIEFSIESVAADCQFTKVVRFQVAGAAPASSAAATAPLQNVTASTIYLDPQQVPEGKQCIAVGGIGPVTPVS
jgi:predicted MPP superfamily phosphohydrolase